MKLIKKAGAWFLAMVMTLNVASGGLSAFAVAEDITCIISHFRLYDETEHALQDDDITVAKPGDIIAVTYALQNNASSRFNFRGWQQHISFNASALTYYEKDATDDPEDPQGDFAEHGYKCLLTMTPSVGNPSDGVTTVSVASSANVGISKNSSLDVCVVLYKVLDGASGNITIQYAQNDNDFLAVGDEKIKGTYSLGVPYSISVDAPTHNVNIDADIKNGSVTSNLDNPVAEDATVTLTVAPETGYQLKADSLKVTDGSGAVELTEKSATEYTFAMGTSDANVTAEFEPIPTYTVNFDGNGATSVAMEPQIFQNGETKKLSANTFVLDGHTFAGWAETATGDVKYADQADFTPPETGDSTTLYAKWTPIPFTIKVTAIPTEGGSVVPNKTAAKEGDVIELTVTPNTDKGYTLDTLTVKDAEGEIETKRSDVMSSDSSGYTFAVRKSDVTVEAKFIIPDLYKITCVPADGGTVTSDKSDNQATTGETVKLTVAPNTSGGYVLKKLTVTRDDDGSAVSFMRINETTYDFAEYTFKMPDSDVTVQAGFYIPRLINVPENVVGGSVKSEPATAGSGETVALTVTANEGYQLKADFPKVADAGGKAIALTKVDEKTYTFTMPDSVVTVSVEFEAVKREVTVTYAPGEGDGDSVTKTERLPFQLPDNPDFTPPTGKRFDGWTLPDGTFLKVGDAVSALNDNAAITAHYKERGGCYVATAVYGSYDCPEVWTLRRFRDNVLAKTWYGRLFIKLYYAVSPTAVKLFGDADWFRNFFRGKLDDMVSNLQENGFESTPYQDTNW